MKVFPATGLVLTFAATKRRLKIELADPLAPTLQLLPVASEKLLIAPATVIVAAVTVEPAVPVFVSVRKLPAVAPQVNVTPELVERKSAAFNDPPVTATCAELADDPKTPKTNPATATDATRVTATMSTVATMGEMAVAPTRFFPITEG